jgi:hypothetical protein
MKIIPEITAVIDIRIEGRTVPDCPLMQNVKTGEAGQREKLPLRNSIRQRHIPE